MADDDPEWMTLLSHWILDEGQVLTCVEAAKRFQVHVNVAKQRLYHFGQKAEGASSVFFLSGRDQHGRLQVKLVREPGIKQQEKLFSKISSKHIYAVARQALLGDDHLQLTSACLASNRSGPLERAYCAVVNKAAMPRQRSAVAVAVNASEPKHKIKVTQEERAKVNDEQEEKAKAKQEEESKEEPKEKAQVSKSKAAGAKGAGGIKGLFAKQSSQPASKRRKLEAIKDQKAEDQKAEEDSPGKENRINEQKEEEEHMQERPPKKKRQEKAATKRRRIQVCKRDIDNMGREKSH